MENYVIDLILHGKGHVVFTENYNINLILHGKEHVVLKRTSNPASVYLSYCFSWFCRLVILIPQSAALRVKFVGQVS